MDILIRFLSITTTFFAIGFILSFCYSILPEEIKFLKDLHKPFEEDRNENNSN